MNADVETKLRRIISAQVELSLEKVKLTATSEDLDMDSLAEVELIFAVEEAFEIDIPDEKKDSFTTVESLLNFVLDATSKKR